MGKRSYLTVTDQFCGAGGSSLGARSAGAHVQLAMNHWKLAIETHNTNFPETDHDCADMSAVDPRRYASTDILITSPECTNHSLAKGARRKSQGQGALFGAKVNPEDERSRATMWDVPRFAEFHNYRAIIVENVVDARMWVMWDAWLLAMQSLGYQHRAVYLNSMHAHPTPQSRDRMYVVFWRKGNRAPDLDVRPRAFCERCELDVDAWQTWKAGRSAGKYRRQYTYTCPRCRAEVEPYYYAALNAIDFSIPATRISDRDRPLQPRTIERIQFGLDKYGRTPLLVTTNQTNRLGGRVRPVTAAMFTQPGCNVTGFVSPFMVDTTHSNGDRAHPMDAPISTQTGRQAIGVVQPFALELRNHGDARGLDEPLSSVCAAGNHHGIVQGAAVINMRDYRNPLQLVTGLDGALPTQSTTSQIAIAQPSPFLISYYGQLQASGMAEAMDTLSTKDRHALVIPKRLRVKDCYFRMLQPSEVGAAMAFPGDYTVLGTARDKVKQYGNAVTPPAMETLIRRVVESLHPETRR